MSLALAFSEQVETWRDFYREFLGPLGDPNDAGWVSVRCPKHSDHHPSAGVNLKSGVFNCFVCGSFSPQRFLQEIIGVEGAPSPVITAPKIDDWSSSPFPLSTEWEVFLKQAQERLSPELDIIKDYQASHGVTFETLKAFGVGYVPESQEQLECLVFPYYVGGKLVAIRGRSFSGLKGGVRGSHHSLFHLDSLDGATQCILVEGESDCLRAQQALGDRIPVIATPTAAFRREWVRELQGIDLVYLVPQADEPSQDRLVPQVIRALGEGRVKVVQLPWRRGELGKDIVDWLRLRFDQDLVDLIPWESPKKLVLTHQELLARADEEIPWLIEGLIARQDKVILAGAQKGMKTFFALNLIRAVALGEEFLFWKVLSPLRVLVVEEEGSPIAFARRVKSLMSDISGDNLFWIHRQGVKLDQDHWRKTLEGLISHLKPDLVLLDPLQRLHSKVEDQSWEMGEVWDTIHEITVRHDCAVIIIHHFLKRGKITQLWDALRGSGRTAGEVDLGIFLERVEPENPDGTTTLRMAIDGRDLPSKKASVNLLFNPTTFRVTAAPEIVVHPILKQRIEEYLLNRGSDWVSLEDLEQALGVPRYRLSSELKGINNIEETGGTGRKPKMVRLKQ